MHFLMLVTLARPNEATSQDTREHVRDLLVYDNSFCGEGGRFGSPLCDWFVIGGRWSGYLQEQLAGDPYRTVLEQSFQNHISFSDTSRVAKHRENLNDLWHRFGGIGVHPSNRQCCDELGSDDDAMLVDQALYDTFLAEFAGESRDLANGCHCTFADLDDEAVEPSFVGRKWLVVVDYHN